MKGNLIGFLLLIPVATSTSYGQGSLNFSSLIIYNKVEAVNNWSPPTSINRQDKFKGTGLGSGFSLNYSVKPTFLVKNKNVTVNLGVGYFKQRFEIERPFDYDSPLQPIFYTDTYSYHCVRGILGIAYSHTINSNLSLTGNISYSWLRSFRQDYTPTSNAGYGHLTQIDHDQIDFGNMLILAVGFNRSLGERFSITLNALAPIYSRWRNDKIFKDDPATFSHPKFALGASIDLIYKFKKNDLQD